ncbi:transposase IS3/IS911 family protein [Paenibacillus curdlanolyticus YK9]|uniref:Transposase IS3/IS911 family protein n=1 Tax=Paenibacillus curdlanolyticus YK9 TaxID=717606 RepID=E0I4F9_9BACL|nr:transposase [Paenibacillus curdlanolyticus]EFM12490.1 transposase IS3/IS911 family protein [Paenibacillus curdlanolyticus YK9]
MKRRFRCPVMVKKELVAEVLAGYRVEVVARQQGMSPSTLSTWVRQYQDEVGDIVVRKQDEAKQMKQDAANFHELEHKYKEALKLLGEKELENNILKDLLKKTNPAALKDLK